MNKFNGSGQMNETNGTDETNGTNEYQDDVGLAGMVVCVTRVDGTEQSGIVRGTRDVVIDEEILATRVLVNVEGNGHLVDTDADRVEVI